MIELLKTLLEEPNKLWKISLNGIKFLLNVIITYHLYLHFFGNLPIIDFTDVKSNFKLINDGFFIILFFLYLLSLLGTSYILPLLTAPLTFYGRKQTGQITGYLDKRSIIKILIFIGAVKEEKQSKQILPGQSIDDFISVLEMFSNDESNEIFHSVRSLFIDNLIHTFIVFTLIYFLFLNSYFSYLITVIIIVLNILLMTCYIIFCAVIAFMNNNAVAMLREFKGLKTMNFVEIFFKENQHYLNIEFNPSPKYKSKFVKNGKEFVVVYSFREPHVTFWQLNILKEELLINKRGLLLISDIVLNDPSTKIISSKSDQFLFLKIESNDLQTTRIMADLILKIN